VRLVCNNLNSKDEIDEPLIDARISSKALKTIRIGTILDEECLIHTDDCHGQAWAEHHDGHTNDATIPVESIIIFEF